MIHENMNQSAMEKIIKIFRSIFVVVRSTFFWDNAHLMTSFNRIAAAVFVSVYLCFLLHRQQGLNRVLGKASTKKLNWETLNN